MGTTRYAHWTKEVMEEECKRRRLSIKGGLDEMTRRLSKEDRTQPKLLFRTQGGQEEC